MSASVRCESSSSLGSEGTECQISGSRNDYRLYVDELFDAIARELATVLAPPSSPSVSALLGESIEIGASARDLHLRMDPENCFVRIGPLEASCPANLRAVRLAKAVSRRCSVRIRQPCDDSRFGKPHSASYNGYAACTHFAACWAEFEALLFWKPRKFDVNRRSRSAHPLL